MLLSARKMTDAAADRVLKLLMALDTVSVASVSDTVCITAVKLRTATHVRARSPSRCTTRSPCV